MRLSLVVVRSTRWMSDWVWDFSTVSLTNWALMLLSYIMGYVGALMEFQRLRFCPTDSLAFFLNQNGKGSALLNHSYKTGHINQWETLCANRRSEENSGETARQGSDWQRKKGKWIQEDSGFNPDQTIKIQESSPPLLRPPRWGTTWPACSSTCRLGCSSFPWTGGRGPCAPGGCSTSPGGEGRSGGEVASRRSWEVSGCGPGNPLPRPPGARGGRARSWRSAAGRRSCAGRRWSCGGGGGSSSGCRRPS